MFSLLERREISPPSLFFYSIFSAPECAQARKKGRSALLEILNHLHIIQLLIAKPLIEPNGAAVVGRHFQPQALDICRAVFFDILHRLAPKPQAAGALAQINLRQPENQPARFGGIGDAVEQIAGRLAVLIL